MKNMYLLLSLILLSTPVFANHPDHAHDDANASQRMAGIEGAACEDTVTVAVNGLVCDFCARALEKVFSRQDEVAGIDVDLDKGIVTIAMKPDKTIADAKLKEFINDSGYNVTHINKGCGN